jgi:hypothetical protein
VRLARVSAVVALAVAVTAAGSAASTLPLSVGAPLPTPGDVTLEAVSIRVPVPHAVLRLK